jgi:hypothetical protein
MRLVIIALALACLAFTTSSRTIELHYRDYGGTMPKSNTVYVCHGSGCKYKTRFRFSPQDIDALSRIFAGASSPPDERARIAQAIAWAERRVCKTAGTCQDRPQAGWTSIRGQLECVDESMNATSYLLLIQSHRLLKYHKVITPLHRFSFGTFPHWGARLAATDGEFIVDSFFRANGEKPDVLPVYVWAK